MKIHANFIMSGIAAGAVAAAIALSPNASAELSAQACDANGQPQTVCPSSGNYQGVFAPPVRQPSQYQYPYGFLQTL